jgi:hydroxymethylpyrimidine kinase/phosphomethylpyrimidine kinase
LGVQSIHIIPDQEIIAQINSVKDDLEIAAVKTGMLSSPIIIDYIASVFKDSILIVDPVMVATSGDVLAEDSVITAIQMILLPVATLATPNLQEAEILTGIKINNTKDQINAGKRIIEMGCKAALIKGGHGDGGTVSDVLVDEDIHVFEHERVNTNNTHGTGCTLASSIATNLALGASLHDACEKSIDYVATLLKSSPSLGKGNGPLMHNLF